MRLVELFSKLFKRQFLIGIALFVILILISFPPRLKNEIHERPAWLDSVNYDRKYLLYGDIATTEGFSSQFLICLALLDYSQENGYFLSTPGFFVMRNHTTTVSSPSPMRYRQQ